MGQAQYSCCTFTTQATEPDSKNGNMSRNTGLLGAEERFKRSSAGVTATCGYTSSPPVGAHILNNRLFEQDLKLQPPGRLDTAGRRDFSAASSVKQMSDLSMFRGVCSKEPQVDWESLDIREGTFPLLQ